MGAIAGILGSVPENRENIRNSILRRAHLGVEELEIPGGILFHGISRKYHCHALKEMRQREIYCLIFNGNLYNEEELSRDLGLKTTDVNTASLILTAYLAWGKDCVKHFNGVFALAVYEEKHGKLFLARDPMGIKPLFYKQNGNLFLFGSEIKELLAFPKDKAVLNREGALELVMLGPGRRPGSGVLQDIHELKPGHLGIYTAGKFSTERYWQLKDREHRDSFADTAAYTAHLVRDAVKRQIKDSADYGCLLSGGLDSSILCAFCREENPAVQLKTFSVDYLQNDRYFTPGKFQPDSDAAYIRRMQEYLHSHHKEFILTPEDLTDALQNAALARDLPGMGDVDASLLVFSRKVREQVPMVLSGECADEIFAGYPWFRDPQIRQQKGFPWAQNTDLRKQLLQPEYSDAEDFVNDLYSDTCRNSDILPSCQGEDRRIKELMQLNMDWFMQTLVDRNDRMSAAEDLEIRVPFCDIRIPEYLYSIPWSMKDHMGREKGLLRYAVKGLLPEAVRMRKKSPYPKTFDPCYENMVLKAVRNLLVEDVPIWYLIRRDAAANMLEGEREYPFYGQLMKRPQFAAWILQLNFLIGYYNIELLL